MFRKAARFPWSGLTQTLILMFKKGQVSEKHWFLTQVWRGWSKENILKHIFSVNTWNLALCLLGSLFFWHVYVLVLVYFVWPCVPHVIFVTSHREHWPLLIRVSGITWSGSKLLEASRNVILHTRYVSTYVGAGCGRGRRTKKKQNVSFYCNSKLPHLLKLN
jgi:hypothetical protein